MNVSFILLTIFKTSQIHSNTLTLPLTCNKCIVHLNSCLLFVADDDIIMRGISLGNK